MHGVSAQFEAPWSGSGQLDTHYRSMLNMPDSALNGNMAELLADASCRMLSGSGQQLNSPAAQEDLPPLDFADFPTSQPADQPYSGIFPTPDHHLSPQTQTSLPLFPPKSTQRSPAAGDFSLPAERSLHTIIRVPKCQSSQSLYPRQSSSLTNTMVGTVTSVYKTIS